MRINAAIGFVITVSPHSPVLLPLGVGDDAVTLNELMILAGNYPWMVVVFFALPPIVAFGIGLSHAPGKGEQAPRSYFYAVLVYVTCLPGLFALTLIAYTLFFTRQNLLDVNLLIYVLPIASMGLTLGVMARKMKFEKIPGFDRISGLMIILTATFSVLFLLSRTRVWLLFAGSFVWLLALGVMIFFLLRLGFHMVTQNRK
jgi:hypothetical protein